MAGSRDTRRWRWKANPGTGKAGVSRVYPEEGRGYSAPLLPVLLPELAFDL